MFWFDLVGSVLSFFGSIIFASALVKSREQIEDENATYWDKNPYTENYELRTQPYYILAFVLLISGFSVILAKNVTILYGESNKTFGFILSAAFILTGLLLSYLVYKQKNKKHWLFKKCHAKNIFRNIVKENKEVSRKQNLDFEEAKEQIISNLEKRLAEMSHEDTEEEENHIARIKVVENEQQLQQECDNFLNFYNVNK